MILLLFTILLSLGGSEEPRATAIPNTPILLYRFAPRFAAARFSIAERESTKRLYVLLPLHVDMVGSSTERLIFVAVGGDGRGGF